MRFVGLDPPRRHEPGPVLLEHLDRFPRTWRERAAEICAVSERLFAERGHAFYGDADDLVPPSELFERSEAEEAITAVEELPSLYRDLLGTADRLIRAAGQMPATPPARGPAAAGGTEASELT